MNFQQIARYIERSSNRYFQISQFLIVNIRSSMKQTWFVQKGQWQIELLEHWARHVSTELFILCFDDVLYNLHLMYLYVYDEITLSLHLHFFNHDIIITK